MGNFANNAITDVGRMLLADVQYGAIFTPTRIVIGSGSMPSGATAQGMTDVITPVKSLVINKKKRTPDGKCVFGGVYTNEEVTAPFYFRELALYAKAVYLNEDGSVKSEGAETLYSYGNAGTTADYMPAYSSSTVVEKQIDLVAWVGNDAQVDLSIESGIYITHGDFDSHAARHAAGGDDPITPESIGAAPAGYGLGGYPQKTISLAELDSVFNTGWYWLSQPGSTLSGVGFNYANVLVHGIEPTSCTQELRPLATNIVLRRRCHQNSWGEWEVENPPFVPGVEYRTTEQRNHKSVFKSLGTDGVLRYRLDGETAWKTYAQEHGATPDGYGLGTNSKGFDFTQIDNITANGWYASASGATTINNVTFYYCHLVVANYDANACRQTLYPVAYDTVLTRMRYNGVWGEWEAINPPMFTGVEYRTTDRYQGVAVYKKVDATGNILWRKDGESRWHLLSSANYVAEATVE